MTEATSSSSPTIAVLVNSTDRYDDCWAPFFTLFAHYWPTCRFPVILNTETKSYQHQGLSLRTSQVGRVPSSHPLTWSESLLRCLDGINEDYVLYLQEDYFLNDFVDEETVQQFLEIMDREQYVHIRLMELGGNDPYVPSRRYPQLWHLPERANYLVSLQAGLWRRVELRAYLRAPESAWQFERWGTRRARRDAARFLCPDLNLFNRRGRHIVPYLPTGIVRGKWYEPAVVELFARHGIVVDFQGRGFYRPSPIDRLILRARGRGRRLLMHYGP